MVYTIQDILIKNLFWNLIETIRLIFLKSPYQDIDLSADHVHGFDVTGLIIGLF